MQHIVHRAMRIFHTPESLPGPTALAIGNFDGLHRGHQAILQATEGRANARGHTLSRAVLTFSPHPLRLLRPEAPVKQILRFSDKCRLLQQAGIAMLAVQRFDASFARTSAEEFIERHLRQRFCAEHVVVGEDFVFGKGRQGTVAMLRDAGLAVTALPALHMENGICSSTRIREALSRGDMILAARLLGRNFFIRGRVMRGNQKGRLIGFPTLNLPLHDWRVIPQFGVYEALVDGRQAIANIGTRPTITESAACWLEAHLLSCPGRIPGYGDRITVELQRFIRPEQRFPSIDALQNQIAQDIEAISPSPRAAPPPS